jgi:hypothetical protein
MRLFTSEFFVIVNIYRYYIGSTNGDVSYKKQYGFSDWAHLCTALKSHEGNSGHTKLFLRVYRSWIKTERHKHRWQVRTAVCSERFRMLEMLFVQINEHCFAKAMWHLRGVQWAVCMKQWTVFSFHSVGGKIVSCNTRSCFQHFESWIIPLLRNKYLKWTSWLNGGESNSKKNNFLPIGFRTLFCSNLLYTRC